MLADSMHWVILSLISALFLGCYDLVNKHAVRVNAVLPVIFLGTISSACVWTMLLLAQRCFGVALPGFLIVPALTWHQHLLIVAKAAIVGGSWVFNYFGLKNLPLSLASPIRATGPLWTLLLAVLILTERPTAWQLAGVATALVSFIGLSWAGSQEGVHFHRNKWVGCMFTGTLLGTGSSLYDKYLLGHLHFAASTVQAWFTIYLVFVFLPLALGWKLRIWTRNEFHWRWSIPFIGLVLLVSDFAYFTALRDPQGLISVVASVRRGSTLIAFLGGIWIFKEGNAWRKLPAVLGVMAGIILTMIG